MSEKQKTGEDLIEKVEQTTAETTEETKEAVFDPKAFNAGEEYIETKKEDIKGDTKVEPNSAEEAEESNEDDFSWDNVEVEKEEEQEEEEAEEDWDSVTAPEDKETKEEKKTEDKEAPYDWETLANEMGVKAKDA